jgi:hypothetical protein
MLCGNVCIKDAAAGQKSFMVAGIRGSSGLWQIWLAKHLPRNCKEEMIHIETMKYCIIFVTFLVLNIVF